MVSVVAVTLGILSLAVICTSVLTAIGVRYRTEPGARWFTVTMGFVSLWIVVSLVSRVTAAVRSCSLIPARRGRFVSGLRVC